jgi:hypothetical protein
VARKARSILNHKVFRFGVVAVNDFFSTLPFSNAKSNTSKSLGRTQVWIYLYLFGAWDTRLDVKYLRSLIVFRYWAGQPTKNESKNLELPSLLIPLQNLGADE